MVKKAIYIKKVNNYNIIVRFIEGLRFWFDDSLCREKKYA